MVEALSQFKDAPAPLTHNSGKVVRHQKASVPQTRQKQASLHVRPVTWNLKLDDEYAEAVVAEFKASSNVCLRGRHHNRKSAATRLLVGRNVTLSGLERGLRPLSCEKLALA